MKPVFEVAKNEFSMVVRSRIVIVFAIIVIIWAIVNTTGYSRTWEHLQLNPLKGVDPFYFLGFGSFFNALSMFLAFLSMCVGVISIADERSKGSLRILMAKPLYRRDIITGKFLGISIFLLLLTVLSYALFVVPLMVFYGGPVSFNDFLLRTGAVIVLTFLNSSFTLGLVMFFGILLGKAEAMVVSLVYIALEWLLEVPPILSSIFNYLGSYVGKSLDIMDPVMLLWSAQGIGLNSYIFSPDLPPFNVWLGNSMPYIVLMVAEVLVIVLVNCALFTREES